MLALSPYIEPVERLDRAFRLAMCRAECGEIMQADQPLGCRVHGIRIQWLRNLPCPVGFKCKRSTPVGYAVDIFAADAGKTGMPIIRNGFASEDGNRLRS